MKEWEKVEAKGVSKGGMNMVRRYGKERIKGILEGILFIGDCIVIINEINYF